MPPFDSCCAINGVYGVGHDKRCDNHPHKGAAFLDYPDGIGDIRFHFRNGSSHILRGVVVDSIGGDPNGNKDDTNGDFQNGDIFHVPNVVWWEVVYER